jgi:2-polyprenyl-3-methyl-5-hydroxy-6-metoxy-1,4-benzoquinol methylase
MIKIMQTTENETVQAHGGRGARPHGQRRGRGRGLRISAPDADSVSRDRLESEKSFHDAAASKVVPAEILARNVQFKPPDDWGAVSSYRLGRDMLEAIGDVRGKVVLVYGCGCDGTPVWFAKRGAIVDAVDLSPVSIGVQQEMAQLAGLEFGAYTADAHRTLLPSRKYDLIYGTAILHHLDVSLAAKELARLLKPGGRAVFRDNLAGNIFLRLFRKATPWLRTPDEHPLTGRDIEVLGKYFGKVEFSAYSLTLLAYSGIFKVLNLVLKRLGTGKRLRTNLRIDRLLDRIDGRILALLPVLRSQAWLCLIRLEKPVHGEDIDSGNPE